MLYHGVSHMALKGLIDMGDNNIGGGGNGESFSQLPTQSVRLLFPRFSAYPGACCINFFASECIYFTLLCTYFAWG